MFESKPYKTAVASADEEGVNAALAWCAENMGDGPDIAIWTALKGNLRNDPLLESFVARYQEVRHVVGRGGGTVGRGPAILAWARLDDIGPATRYGSGPVCVIEWGNVDELTPWVLASEGETLGTLDPIEGELDIDPVILEGLKHVTMTINHNNTISAGYEKNAVVRVLLALHDHGHRLDPVELQGWALANGWRGENPNRLANFVRDINAGKRPRATPVRPDFIDLLRDRAADESCAP